MSKVYPSEKKHQELKEKVDDYRKLTVWMRSSMSFQGTDGFTFFDQHGSLVFRVDSYSRNHPCVAGGLVLMDGAGNSLLSLKPQMLSMQCQWNAYIQQEDDACIGKRCKVFSLRSGPCSSLFFNMAKHEGYNFSMRNF